MEIAHKVTLEIDTERLPDKADGAAGENYIVAWLYTVQVFKEEATARKAILQVVLSFQ